jgi:hypothetical protein
MSDDRKRPLWPSILALLVGLPVLYVASSAPVIWVRQHRLVNREIVRWYERPFQEAMIRSPECVAEALLSYRTIFLSEVERGTERNVLAFRRAVGRF